MGDLPFDHLERAPLERRPARVVERAGRGRLRERQHLACDGADGAMLLDQQRRHVAVAGVAHARKKLLLLEVEMPADVLLDVPREHAGELNQLRVARVARPRRARERLLDAAEQLEIDAMLVVERTAHLALIAHGGTFPSWHEHGSTRSPMRH
jgi:hypothetical protein